MNIFVKRIKSETPKFFKRLRRFSLYLGGMSLASIGAIAIINTSITINFGILPTILGYVTVACAFTAGTSQFATTDKKLQDANS